MSELWPEEALVPSLAKLNLENLKSASILSTKKEIAHQQTVKGLDFSFPTDMDKKDFAYVVKMEFDGPLPNLK